MLPRFLFILVVVMVAAIAAGAAAAYARTKETEEEDVAETVKFLLGTPASDEDRQAVNEFMEFIRLIK